MFTNQFEWKVCRLDVPVMSNQQHKINIQHLQNLKNESELKNNDEDETLAWQ